MDQSLQETQLELDRANEHRNGEGSQGLLGACQCYFSSAVAIFKEFSDQEVVKEGHLVFVDYSIQEHEVGRNVVYIEYLAQLILSHNIDIAKVHFPFILLGQQAHKVDRKAVVSEMLLCSTLSNKDNVPNFFVFLCVEKQVFICLFL